MISSLLYFYFYSLPASFIVRLLTYPSESRRVCRETRSPVACAQATDMRTRNIIRTLCRIRPITKKYSVKREKPRARKKAAATHIYIFPSLNTVISYLLYHSLTFCQYNIFKKYHIFFVNFSFYRFITQKRLKRELFFTHIRFCRLLRPVKFVPNVGSFAIIETNARRPPDFIFPAVFRFFRPLRSSRSYIRYVQF